VFETWMKQQSELVQATAEAFIENYVATVAQQDLEKASPTLGSVLGPILRLDALCRVEAQLGWYLLEGLISAQDAREVRSPIFKKKNKGEKTRILCCLLA
jgi:Acyl-CoA oxidase